MEKQRWEFKELNKKEEEIIELKRQIERLQRQKNEISKTMEYLQGRLTNIENYTTLAPVNISIKELRKHGIDIEIVGGRLTFKLPISFTITYLLVGGMKYELPEHLKKTIKGILYIGIYYNSAFNQWETCAPFLKTRKGRPIETFHTFATGEICLGNIPRPTMNLDTNFVEVLLNYRNMIAEGLTGVYIASMNNDIIRKKEFRKIYYYKDELPINRT
jgi:hypothetical protein